MNHKANIPKITELDKFRCLELDYFEIIVEHYYAITSNFNFTTINIY